MNAAEKLVETLKTRGMTVAAAESCTGGLVAAKITAVPGASAVVGLSAVTYSAKAKAQIGVDPALIERYGVVSSEVAEAMAVCVRQFAGADLGLSVTGAAGPTPCDGKPVGTVYCGIATATSTRVLSLYLPGLSRAQIRETAAEALLTEAAQFIDSKERTQS